MIQTVFALVVFLFPLAYSPGPGNMFFAANGARFGFRSTVPANFGYHIATWVVTVAIGLGFIAVIDEFPRLFVALKAAGALYVLWIAWTFFVSGTWGGQEKAKPAGFWDGIVLLVLNPKAYVIMALMFTQFLDTAKNELSVSVILISTVFTLNNLVAMSVWAFIGNKIAEFYRTREQARKLNVAFGMVLAAVSFWMLVA